MCSRCRPGVRDSEAGVADKSRKDDSAIKQKTPPRCLEDEGGLEKALTPAAVQFDTAVLHSAHVAAEERDWADETNGKQEEDKVWKLR